MRVPDPVKGVVCALAVDLVALTIWIFWNPWFALIILFVGYALFSSLIISVASDARYTPLRGILSILPWAGLTGLLPGLVLGPQLGIYEGVYQLPIFGLIGFSAAFFMPIGVACFYFWIALADSSE